jgi:hypothetical protein
MALGLLGPIGTLANGLFNQQSAPPVVPYNPVSPQQTQAQAITGNLSELPSLESLLSQSNTFQQGQASSILNAALPGYSGLASSLTSTATNLAANPYAIPQSVVSQLSQYAAENNISEGTGAASGFSSSNLLRSLGINALQYGQSNMSEALSALSTLTSTAPTVSPMSPLSFLVTPTQQQQNQVYTNTLQQQEGQAGANAATAASNYNSANLWDSITSAAGQLSPTVMQALMSGFGSGATSVGAGGGAAALAAL